MLLSFTTNPIDILTYGAERDGANLLDVITFLSECRELHPIIESHFSGPISNKSVSRPTPRGQLADSTTVACIWFLFLCFNIFHSYVAVQDISYIYLHTYISTRRIVFVFFYLLQYILACLVSSR